MEEEGVGVGRGEEGGGEALSWRPAGQGGAASPPSSADPPFPLWSASLSSWRLQSEWTVRH